MKTAFPDPTNLARYMRIFLGMTQKELACACGLNLFSISNYENGRSKLQIGNLCRLASFFDISADDLIRNNFRAAMPKLSGLPVRRAAAERHLLEYRRSTYENGRAGERLAARLERERLKGTEFENGVNESFADDPTAGYDVSSFDLDGTPKCLEVKATSEDLDEPFFMTAYEKAFMEHCAKKGIRYELHRVYHLDADGNGEVAVFTLEDLKEFCFTPSEFSVRRVRP